MSEELNNLIDDILKEKLKLHYENEELEAQGKLIKELCKEIERLHSIIKEVREYIENNSLYEQDEYYDYEENLILGEPTDELTKKELLEILDKVDKEK